jgi:uncharacterized membrane protein YhaH (DUF805 family)
MSQQQFIDYWYVGLTVAALIVFVVAVIVIALVVTARRIHSNATRAIGVASQIVGNTQPIWELETTNAVVSELAEESRHIAAHAAEIADALEGTRRAVQ